MAEQSTASGYIIEGFEGTSDTFTQLESLPHHGHNRLTRAKRYGRWHLLKSIAPELSDKLVYQEMLGKELDILMRLQHPGVVQVIGMEEVAGLGRCIVMEWIEGMTLEQWLTHNPSRDERRRIVDQLMDTVSYIHSLGIVHRDLKPSNIMITNTGQHVKLIDFGLADTDVHAVLKQPAGTPSYMSPEQASASIPDIRNDIYSLGIIMKEMNPGRPYTTAAAHCLRPINERYQNIHELRHDLTNRLQLERWLRRGSLAIPLVILLGLLFWLMRPSMVDDPTGLVDSLRTQYEINVDAIRQNDSANRQMGIQLSKLRDSLSVMRDENASLVEQQHQRDSRQQQIDTAISEGIRRADRAIARTGLRHHLDTVSDRNYVWLDFEGLSRAGQEETKLYMASLEGKFDNKELAEIEYAILNHCKKWEQEVFRRVQKLAGTIPSQGYRH